MKQLAHFAHGREKIRLIFGQLRRASNCRRRRRRVIKKREPHRPMIRSGKEKQVQCCCCCCACIHTHSSIRAGRPVWFTMAGESTAAGGDIPTNSETKKENNNLFRDDCTREFAFTLRHCRWTSTEWTGKYQINSIGVEPEQTNKIKRKKREKVNALGGQQWIDSGNGNNFVSATAVAGEVVVVVMDVDDLRWWQIRRNGSSMALSNKEIDKAGGYIKCRTPAWWEFLIERKNKKNKNISPVKTTSFFSPFKSASLPGTGARVSNDNDPNNPGFRSTQHRMNLRLSRLMMVMMMNDAWYD